MAVDRRVRKTQTAIKNAFIHLLEEKDLDHITVSDITDAADINRGTFYLHYEDKYILLESMEDEYAKQLYDLTRFRDVITDVENPEQFNRKFSEYIMKKVVTHVSDNMDFYRVILTLERRSKIEEKIMDIIKENLLDQADEKNKIAGIPVEYFHSYVTGSMISVIKYWVQDENRMDVDTLIKYISRIVFNGPLRLVAGSHNGEVWE
ncbi:TetR/AcrR family transcriptional regulator [Staphylococcus carnosus]|uniref:TetR family transcriptional regulator n=3 Tax=Staphylococcus carnosus TaxID=1281 RepID=A0AAJ0NHA3_STACA|nr:TetR/AcrR family transcriptional regulator [Staphylococcus carnosus]KKB25737.1 TetR family transcriptional regulator [Staphylococcus carnosus]QQS84259.1 TetR/AcrR family transcriptional regulator [Staphylococcus carnosus]QRQ04200.1 TetR/AcrR family transcriptional regulator [Staphylococcus carnosus]UTB83800.1 TetR family transcriptional regulator [Staphylococcus carnosus]UTB99545.1 TetR family transcriptional regulator [Staphylococcus carnosus]